MSIAAQKFATSTDCKDSDTTWELRMSHLDYIDIFMSCTWQSLIDK